MAKYEKFTSAEELKEFAQLQAQAARVNAQLRIMKNRAAATLGDADAVTLGGVTLAAVRSERMQFSKEVLSANWGADVYELCKIPTVCTSYEISQK